MNPRYLFFYVISLNCILCIHLFCNTMTRLLLVHDVRLNVESLLEVESDVGFLPSAKALHHPLPPTPPFRNIARTALRLN